MRWVRPISARLDASPETIGGKAHGLVVLHRLGLPVPDAFAITTDAGREVLRSGRLPDGLVGEVTTAVDALEPSIRVSVRSGAAASMPGMLSTILDVDATSTRLEQALRTVFTSWDTPRARTYRDLHDIPHDLGTAVIVQAMVFGDRDRHSGAGAAFSRDPGTGEPLPFGDVLFGRRGDDVVSGRFATRQLGELAAREPTVWSTLVDALGRAERHLRDACYVEFTYESGRLWFLQVRPGRFTGRAALRVAADLTDDGVIDRREALRRITPHDLARTPRIARTDDDIVLGRGVGACPGVASGRVATTSEAAVLLAGAGPVVLVRPETSPLDMRGLAAAAGVVTSRGGPACHAAIVARSLGRPAVVGAAQLTIDEASGTVTAGARTVADGTEITIDGATGEIVLGRAATVSDDIDQYRDRLLGWADDISGNHTERSGARRLRDAHVILRRTEER